MMISNLKQKGNFQTKKEGEINCGKISKASTSARQWFGLRNPRIVRVSRSLGGKDRHSKVCTIKGLRDRRIRLAVPTALQLYDLQERLGLGQPSKVIDWLLEVTKLDIDKLPPLQFSGFEQFPQHMLVSHDLISNRSNQSSSILPFFDANSASTFMKDVEDGDSMRGKSKGKAIRTNDHHHHHQQTNQDRLGDFHTQVGAQNFLLSNSLSETTSSLSIGSHGLYSSQTEDHHPKDATFFAPSGSQLFFCPPQTTPTFFTPYPSYITTQTENEQRQLNHIQFLGSSLSVVPTLHSFPKLLLPQQNCSQEKDNNATGS